MEGIDFPGIDGFLGTRASLMLDVLFLAMFAIVLYWAGAFCRSSFDTRYRLHKWVQVVLGAVLCDGRGVRNRHSAARLGRPAAGAIGGHPAASVFTALYIHLVFALTTVVLWPVVIFAR